jgi:hypothetical protein
MPADQRQIQGSVSQFINAAAVERAKRVLK